MLLHAWLKSWKSCWAGNCRQVKGGRKHGHYVDNTRIAVSQRVELFEDRVLLATVNWIGGSGDWSTAANWRDDAMVSRLPGPGDDAVIDLAGVAVTHAVGLHTVKSLTLNNTFTLSGGILTVTGDVLSQNGNSFALGNGTLASATVATGTTITQTGNGTLDGVTIAGGSTIQVANGNSSTLSVKNGLTVNGTVLIGDTVGNAYFGAMFLTTTQTISGSGSIIFGNNVNNNISASKNGVTITLGPDLKIRGKNGGIRGSSTSGDFTHYILQGTIESDVAGGSLDVGHFATDVVNTGQLESSNGGSLSIRSDTLANTGQILGSTGGSLTISPGSWSNSGTTSITGGGTLTVAAGTWTNTGTLTIDNSTINLGGSFDKAKLGNFTRSGGTVNLTGTYLGDGTPLVLDASTGIWNLGNGGTLQNITLVTAPGFSLTQTGNGTLDNVTIPGGSIVQVANGNLSALSVKNGLTVDGTILIGDTVGNAYFGAMFLTTTQTISGSGSIIFGNNVNNNISASKNGVTITLGPDLKIRGKNGSIRGFVSQGEVTHYVMQGLVSVDVSGGTIDVGFQITDLANSGRLDASTGGNLIVRPGTWSNSGTTSISGGGMLTIAPNSWTNTGTVAMIDSTVNLGGAFTKTALGTFTRVGGIVNLTGTIDITGTGLALDNTTGSWILQGGTISGGRISTAGTAELFAGATQGTLNAVTLAGKFSGSRAAVTGGLTLEQGLIDVGLLSLNGTQTLGGTGTVTFTGNNPNNDVRVSNNATLTIGPGVTIHGETGFIGSPFTGRILNLGTIAADGGGTLTVQGINNFSSGVLTGGTWKVAGNSTLLLIGADIITNAADILRDGANARLLSNVFSTNALSSLTTNTAAGSLRLLNGASLTTSASSSDNQGSLTIGSGSTLTVGGGYLTAGATVIDGSLITNSVTVDPAGTLSGSGTVTGNVVNNGQVRPGSPLGSLSINGSYAQRGTGRLEIEIGGTIAGSQYDRLRVSGPATLDGSLAVRLANGFGPTTGQHFEIMKFSESIGAFSAVTGLSQGRFPLFDLTVNAANMELNALANGTDLAFDGFQSNTFPLSAVPGQDVSLTYTVKNLSEPPANGDWVDSVYLSRDNVLDPNDTLLTRIDHRGGVTGFGSYTETLTTAFPGLAEGGYRVIVVADSRGLASDADRSNNSGVSTQAINVSVPLLTPGTPVNGSIAPGKDLYFRVLAAPGEDITLTADFAAAPGAEVFIRYRSVPDRTNFDDASPTGDLHPRLLLRNPVGGTYYLQLHGREDAGADVHFSLKADAAGFEVTKVSPLRGSNLVEPAIIELNGSQFTPQTLVHLLMPGGQSRFGESVHFVNANRIVATVDLAGLPTGNYQVVAEDAGKTAIAFDTFTVTANPPGETGAFIWLKNLSSTVSRGNVTRQFIQQKIAFGEFNTSDSPLPASLYVIEATNVKPSQEKVATIGSDTVPPRMLPGDYRNDDLQIVSYQPATSGHGVKSTYSLFAIEPTQTSMNWNAQKANLRPDTVSLDAWDAIWENLRPRLGETVADFWALLTNDSEKLAVVGDSVVDIHRLFSLELQMANNMPAVPVPASAVDVAFPEPGLPLVFSRGLGETLTGRFRQGRLGRGWTDNFDISISADATTGTATLKQGGIIRYFGRLADGSYESVPGDFGVLSKVSGAFQLRESSGDVTKFRSDGLLDSLEDANGNRITAGYVGNQLTSLTHSNGAALTLTYNAQGRIREVTDPAGGVATYEYDVSGEHLIRVITIAGTTEYGYSADLTGPRKHALTSITFLDGTHLFFDYDSNGRLARQQGDGGAQIQRFAYDTASFSETYARDQVTTFLHDDSFRIRQVRDPLDRLSYINYDDANHPVIIGVSGGGESSIDYNAQGNPAFVQNPIGEAQGFTYERAHNRLVNWEDALGHDTQYQHDSNGNLQTTTHADGSTEQYSYDTQGNLVGTVNRLGQIIQFTYNSRGQVTRKDLPGGVHVDYTYNARDNLETVIDASGTTRLEYLDAQNPDLLTKITYANGRFLEYIYQNGRRIRMADQAGFATDYSYDSAGRLDILRDGSSMLIVDYDYDLSGQLTRETRGNGTLTDYAYDNAGQLLGITHRAPDASIQSQFVYAYDNLGRRTSVTTLEGVTTYRYDGAGRLTRAALPSGRVLPYTYDAAGNRTVASDTGVNTTYTVNDLNQYLAFGGTTQTFDAAGNLVLSSNPIGDSTYSYDVEGRLASQITPTGTWTYEYDVLGNRIASTQDGVRTEYLVDPSGLGNVVGEYDGAGNLRAHYVHGLGLTSRVDVGGPAAFYNFDAVGNTTQLTGAGGTVLNSYSYLPFGESLSATETVANPFEYVGQFGVMREGSGIDYMRNRWYEPTQGRFTQVDPIGLAGGTNSYSYADNNVLSLIDPSGLAVDPATWAAFESALSWWKAYDAAQIAARAASPPFGSLPPGVQPGAPQVWSPSISADPLARSIGPQGLNYSQFAAQVERAAAEQAAKAIRAAIARSLARGAAYVAIAAGVVSIASSLSAFETFVLTGNDVGCMPGVPASMQVCNPSIDFVTGKHIQTITVEQLSLARDPNDITGPAGFGTEGFIFPQPPLPYLIRFQNLPAAEGPAAEVFVTHVLDADLDLNTFELDEFGFGDLIVPVPAGRQVYATRLDLRSTRGVFVDVTAGLDRATRTVGWRFQAIDPETLDLPVSPFVGFLPPDRIAPEGQGFVSFSIRAKAASPTGTRIEAQASIVFDTNAPIVTNIALNTIDAGRPSSSVAALPALTNSASFNVSWSGRDDSGGSGIGSYDVYCSEDGGPYVQILTGTTLTSTLVPGVFGHTYRFFSIATDNVGLTEPYSEVAEATITTQQLEVPVLLALPATTQNLTPTISWQPAQGAALYDVWISNLSTNASPVLRMTVTGTTLTPATPLGIGRYRVWVRSVHAAGNASAWSLPTTFQINTRVTLQTLDKFQPTARPTVSWDTLPGAVRYDLWIDNMSTGQIQFVRRTDVTATSWAADTDFPLGRYRVWVQAIDAARIRATWSAFREIVVLTPPVATSAQGGTFDRTPEFAWSAVPGAVNYDLYIVNRNTGATTIHQPGIVSTAWTPSVNLPDGPYRWHVYGVDAQGLHSYASASTLIYVGGRTELVLPLASSSAMIPQFVWRAVTGAARYELWVDRVGGPIRLIHQINLQQTQFTSPTPLVPGAYRAWVRAVSTTGETASWSPVKEFSIVAGDGRSAAADQDLSDIVVGLGELPVLLPEHLEEVMTFHPETSSHPPDSGFRPEGRQSLTHAEVLTGSGGISMSLPTIVKDHDTRTNSRRRIRKDDTTDQLEQASLVSISPAELDEAVAADPAMLFLDQAHWFHERYAQCGHV